MFAARPTFPVATMGEVLPIKLWLVSPSSRPGVVMSPSSAVVLRFALLPPAFCPGDEFGVVNADFADGGAPAAALRPASSDDPALPMSNCKSFKNELRRWQEV